MRRVFSDPSMNARWSYGPLQRFLGPMLVETAGWAERAATEGFDNHVAADLIGVSFRTIVRWKAEGLSDRAADHAAIALRVHPAIIWGKAWFDVIDLDELEAAS